MHRRRWGQLGVALASAIVLVGCSDKDAPTDATTARPGTGEASGVSGEASDEFPTTCEIWSHLVDRDAIYVEEEPFEFGRRDRLSIRIRAALGQIRYNSYLQDDPADPVAGATMVLERADFSESGLLTSLEVSAVHEIDDELSEACNGVALSPDGMLLSSG